MIAPGKASPRPQSARWLALVLTCALAVAQLLLVGHQTQHADAVTHADCALCLAGSPLDHSNVQRAAAVPAARVVFVPAAAPSFPPAASPARRANARAPPLPLG
ncbi:MAG: hypothetical protein MUE39_05065 [Gammaproteobacteria bacterium]|nr:hypothetical protein [Gammaproteobacteria bacterium]